MIGGWCVAKDASSRVNQAAAFVVQNDGALKLTAWTFETEANVCSLIASANNLISAAVVMMLCSRRGHH